MKPHYPSQLAVFLSRIEAILWREGNYEAAKHLGRMIALICSAETADQTEFRRLITEDKYVWLGMGTIADNCFCDPTTNREFRAAYLGLAEECERCDLASIYSRDVLKIFGNWAQRGI